MATSPEDGSRARLDAIIDLYAGNGLPAFPVRHAEKKPHIRGWQVRATDEGRGIYRLFAPFPRCNVGLMMGGEIRPGEFVFALDVDYRDGGKKSHRRLLKKVGLRVLPATAEAATGGGGRHYLMTAPFPVRCGKLGANLPGLDIKGVGGYIVAEPSIHPIKEQEYVWTRTPRQGIAPAPAGLSRALPRHGGPSPRAQADAAGAVGTASQTGRPSPRARATRRTWPWS